MNKKVILIAIAVIVAISGFWWLTRPRAQAPASNNSSSQSAIPNSASNHVRGNDKSGAILVEYGDFQCPACGQYYPVVEQLYEQYKDKMTFQFRNFPLDQIHQNARAGSRAAEAASAQGKFWEMYNQLYSNQNAWSTLSSPLNTFTGYATTIGLNTDQFKKDYASSAVNAVINFDITEGQKLKATSTPTFIINGVKVEENPRDVDSFKKLLDNAIAAKATTPPAQQ